MTTNYILQIRVLLGFITLKAPSHYKASCSITLGKGMARNKHDVMLKKTYVGCKLSAAARSPRQIISQPSISIRFIRAPDGSSRAIHEETNLLSRVDCVQKQQLTYNCVRHEIIHLVTKKHNALPQQQSHHICLCGPRLHGRSL